MIKIRRILKFSLTTIILFAQINAQTEEGTLVKFNNGSILESEFRYRLNFSPKEGMHEKTKSEGIKRELLYTMVAEKLWALEAIEKGYESYTSVITAKNVIEKMFVRDALYRKEIKDKINLDSEEIEKGLKLYAKVLRVTVFFSENKNELSEIYSSLNNNKNIDSVIEDVDTLTTFQKTIPIGFGDLDQLTENFIYNIEPAQFTAPIQTKNGWSLYYLHEIISKNENDIKDKSENYKAVVKILKERQEDISYNLFYKRFFADKNIHVNGKLFDALTGKIHEIFVAKEDDKLLTIDESGNKRFLLDSYDVRKVEKEMAADLLDRSFIEFENDPIDLRTFVREISFSSFSAPTTERDSINIYLDKKVKKFIKYELLAREGYKYGLEKLPEVKKWVDIWYKSSLYQSIRNDFFSKGNNPGKDEHINKNNFECFIDSTIELAHKYSYEVNEDLFTQIKQGNINLYVVRYLGFGGSIAGVPISYPFIEWFLEMRKRQKENFENIL